MKNSWLSLILLFPLIAFTQAELDIKKQVHKFPKTKEGILLEHNYFFTNTGNEPLVITKTKVSCSCTTVEFPLTTILPNKSGIIHVSFDTSNKIAWQDRTVEVYSNAKKNPVIIRFKVMVDNEK